METGLPSIGLAVQATGDARKDALAWEVFFNLALDAMTVSSFDGHFKRVNPAFSKALGYSEAELYSTPTLNLVHAHDRDRCFSMRESLKAGNSVSGFENRLLCKDGSWKWFSWSASVDVKSGLIFATARDQTTHRQLESRWEEQEQKIAASAKILALGRMASSIAHEINNPLTVIHGQASRILEMVRTDTIDKRKLKRIGDSLEDMSVRMNLIVRGLRGFAREGCGDPMEEASVDMIIEDTIRLCQFQFVKAGIRMLHDKSSEDIKISCRSVQISQVLLNLLNNAFDAVQDESDKWVKIATEISHGHVSISVSDSGSGVDESIVPSLFESLFTTKPIGKGTGLGLSICRQIINAHGGRIFLDAEAKVTTFVVELPAKT